MAERKTFSFIVDGGQATGGPPIGPALGPLGVNIMQIVKKINELTADFHGMKVPVKVHVDQDTKEFDVEVGVPTTTALLAKEAGIEKGSSQAGKEFVGNVAFARVVSIAKLKQPEMNASSLKAAVKEVIGTCTSMGLKVEGKPPKEVIKEVDEGKWDSVIGGSVS
ncbi:MAG: 50S ribosomal protein L11 [Conexivisphaera sp.]|jgi:large subunit ribosomal protein L11|nr:50S ribosomal protein L11 [Conexivisphaerales archaeon]